MMPIAVALSLATMSLSFAQEACTAPTSNPWLTPIGHQEKIQQAVPLWILYAVQADYYTEAVARLRAHRAIRLGRAEAERMAGSPIMAFPHPKLPQYSPARLKRKRHPYLVRAVYPVAALRVEVGWAGSRLLVLASGMGCAPFIEKPLIVWLEREPGEVVTWAEADL